MSRTVLGSIEEDGSDFSSYSVTTELATDTGAEWQPTGASGSGGGVTHQFSSASGSYSFDFDGGSVDGEFFDSRNDGLSYDYEMSGVALPCGTAHSHAAGGLRSSSSRGRRAS